MRLLRSSESGTNRRWGLSLRTLCSRAEPFSQCCLSLARPGTDRLHATAGVDKPCRHAQLLEPFWCSGPAHDCCRCGYVGIDTIACRDADGAPHFRRRCAAGGVDDVVHDLLAMAPATCRSARRGEPSTLDRDGLPRGLGAAAMVVGHVYLPAGLPTRSGELSVWGRASRRNVAAEAHEHAAAERLMDSVGGSIGGPGLGGGAEIELYAAWDPDCATLAIELDGLPSRQHRGAKPWSDHGGRMPFVAVFYGRWSAIEQLHVAVVAREHKRHSHCRANVAICQLGGTQG